MDTRNAAERPDDQPVLSPAVDVIEDEQGITLRADLAGVPKDGLDVRVDGETLIVEGRIALGESRDLGSVYAEVRYAQYRRAFALSRDLDTSHIDAQLRDGVLQVRVPKREQAKPRRIEVRSE
jgi:HSP20 family molecular chaperone IbpA